jgi:mRNA interferase RelE/StbE
MAYRVIIPRTVQKQLSDLPAGVRERIVKQLIVLQDNPRPHGSLKLAGCENEYRVRVGDYRVRYEVIDRESVVVLLHCKHRKDVYRN